jgi:hypothetical protein
MIAQLTFCAKGLDGALQVVSIGRDRCIQKCQQRQQSIFGFVFGPKIRPIATLSPCMSA